MSERIKQLMQQAGTDTSGKWMGIDNAEKFAELIVGECIRKINDIAESSNNPQPIYRVAVDLLEHFGVTE